MSQININLDTLDIPWKWLDFDGTEAERIAHGRAMVTTRAAELSKMTVAQLRQHRSATLGIDDPSRQYKAQIITSILEAEFSGPGGGRPLDGSDPHRHVTRRPGDAVARALDFLATRPVRTRAEAGLTLECWAHRAELTDREFARAIWAYPVEPRQI